MRAKRLLTTEQYVRRYCFPFVIFGLIICVSLIFFTIRDYYIFGKQYHIRDALEACIVVIVTLTMIWFCIWFFKNDIKRRIVVKKGIKYEAQIIAFERGFGRGNGRNIHFVIQFKEDGNKRKFFSQGYDVDPTRELKDRKCTIYKYKKMYIDNDYNLWPDPLNEKKSIPVEYIKTTWLSRKKDKRFVN